MRFSVVVFITFLFSIASALVIPADAYESIALERRAGRQWVVKAGGGKPQQIYTTADIEAARLEITRSGVRFQNRPNENPRTKPIPSMVGEGIEVALPNKAPGATGKGPARAIFQQDLSKGKPPKPVYKFVAVVAHDQSRTRGVGLHDHFLINPT